MSMTNMTNTSTMDMDMDMTDMNTNTTTITNMNTDTDTGMNDTMTNTNTDENIKDTNVPDTSISDKNMPDTNMPDTNMPDTNMENALTNPHTNTDSSTNTSPGVDTTRKSDTTALGRTVEPVNAMATVPIERTSATEPILTSASKSCRIPATIPVSEFCALIISHYRSQQTGRHSSERAGTLACRITREGSALFSLDVLKSSEKGQRETGTSGSTDTARREEGGHREGVVVDPSLEVERRGIRAEPDGSGGMNSLSEQSDRNPGQGTEMPSTLEITSTGTGGRIKPYNDGTTSAISEEEVPGKRLASSLAEVGDVNGLARGNKRRKMESRPCVLGVSASASRVGYGDGASRVEVSRGHGKADDWIQNRRRENVDDEDHDDKGGIEKWVARCQNIGRYRTAYLLVINALVG
jgi:hypothetical protein